MENLKVSVIITTYKRADMLSRAINSVLNQTYKNMEVIVVDDNNEDSDHRRNTEAIMNQYCDDKRVLYIKHKINKNGAVARNTGIKVATGQIITFLDDDDYYLDTKIEKQLEYLVNNRQYSMVYCGYNRENRDFICNLEGDLSLEILSGRNLIYTNCIMIWKKCSDSFGGWNENFKRNQE
ncbi:MAG: glycosyltransferase family 2 protein, partial [Clostridium perfringens]|nr:glycosyltransferase family 2 protein [Clostridium perfringens]